MLPSQPVRRDGRHDRGATAVEYGLVIGGIAVVILLAVAAMGRGVSAGIQEASATLAPTSGHQDAMALAATGQAPAAPTTDTSGQQGQQSAAGGGATSTDGSGAGTSAGASATGGTGATDTTGAAGTSGAGSGTPADPSSPTDGATQASTSPAPRALAAADWSVLSGQALVNGTTVQTTRSAGTTWQNTSVMNATPWTDPDITLTSTMRLVRPEGVTGFGYGLWLRATPHASSRTVPSGYSFQVDPGAGNRFVLKIWENGAETTLAMSSFPSGFDPTADTAVGVTMAGDTFVATIDGSEVLRVNSLTDLARVKGRTVPTGTQFGLRTWQKADAVMANTMVGVPAS